MGFLCLLYQGKINTNRENIRKNIHAEGELIHIELGVRLFSNNETCVDLEEPKSFMGKCKKFFCYFFKSCYVQLLDTEKGLLVKRGFLFQKINQLSKLTVKI